MKKKVIKKFVMVLGFALLGLLIVGCGSRDSGTDSSSQKNETSSSGSSDGALERIKSSGVLNVATSPGYAPYEFIDLNYSSTEIVGVDMALGKRIAKELGVKMKINEMTFGSIIGSLTQDSVDVALAGMSVTDERKKTISFSEPYLKSENRVITLEKNADKYKSIEDLKEAKIGVQKSTTQETIVNEAIKPAQVVSLEKLPDVILNLISGQVDAVVIEDTVAQQYLLSGNNIVLTDVKIPKKYRYKYTAIGVNKGNDDLIEVINKVIKESEDDGSFDKWIAEYSKRAMESAKSGN